MLFHRRLKGYGAVGDLPLHAQVLAAHVTVGCKSAVNGFSQVEVADDGARAQVEDLLHRLQTDYIDLGMIHYIDSQEEWDYALIVK